MPLASYGPASPETRTEQLLAPAALVTRGRWGELRDGIMCILASSGVYQPCDTRP